MPITGTVACVYLIDEMDGCLIAIGVKSCIGAVGVVGLIETV